MKEIHLNHNTYSWDKVRCQSGDYNNIDHWHTLAKRFLGDAQSDNHEKWGNLGQSGNRG